MRDGAVVVEEVWSIIQFSPSDALGGWTCWFTCWRLRSSGRPGTYLPTPRRCSRPPVPCRRWMRRSSREDRRAETALGERHVRRGLWVQSTWVPLQRCSYNLDPSRPESESLHAGSWLGYCPSSITGWRWRTGERPSQATGDCSTWMARETQLKVQKKRGGGGASRSCGGPCVHFERRQCPMDRMDGLTETPVSTISDVGPSAGRGFGVWGRRSCRRSDSQHLSTGGGCN
jgi:hypothetical protein